MGNNVSFAKDMYNQSRQQEADATIKQFNIVLNAIDEKLLNHSTLPKNTIETILKDRDEIKERINSLKKIHAMK